MSQQQARVEAAARELEDAHQAISQVPSCVLPCHILFGEGTWAHNLIASCGGSAQLGMRWAKVDPDVEAYARPGLCRTDYVGHPTYAASTPLALAANSNQTADIVMWTRAGATGRGAAAGGCSKGTSHGPQAGTAQAWHMGNRPGPSAKHRRPRTG